MLLRDRAGRIQSKEISICDGCGVDGITSLASLRSRSLDKDGLQGTEDIMRIVAAAFFYPLLWLRNVVFLLGCLVSGLGTMAAVVAVVVSLFSKHRFWLPAGLFAIGSFISFLLLQVYDSVLFWLNPTGRSLTLYQ
jgi:hypothetical protein